MAVVKEKTAPTPPSNERAVPRETVQRAKPVVVTTRAKVVPKELPDLVRVRAIERGQYGLDIDIIIRNPGEVFDMATSAMRKWPLGEKEHPTAYESVIITTEKGDFELPGWVELVGDEETVPAEDAVSHGHSREFRGQVGPGGERNMDVI
jgi:hypothetical protein